MLLGLRQNAAADILLPIQFKLVRLDQRVIGDVISARVDRWWGKNNSVGICGLRAAAEAAFNRRHGVADK